MSDTLVCFARLLTSHHIRTHPDDFVPFIEALFPGLSLARFCAAEVEGMGKECDQLQITALAQALGTPVRIVYLDQSPSEHATEHVLPDDSAPAVVALLYRPGHYDVLYATE